MTWTLYIVWLGFSGNQFVYTATDFASGFVSPAACTRAGINTSSHLATSGNHYPERNVSFLCIEDKPTGGKDAVSQ
jgi:hypothetical protein